MIEYLQLLALKGERVARPIPRSLSIVALVAILALFSYVVVTQPVETESEPSRLDAAPMTATPDDAPDPHFIVARDEAQPISDSVVALEDRARWIRSLAEWLIQNGDAESLASAALLMNGNATLFTDSSEQRTAFRLRLLDLVDRAASRAPADAAIQMLALSLCMDTASQSVGCDPSGYARALRQADLTNAFASIGTLSQARKKGETDAVSTTIADMAAARRFDDYRAQIDAMFARATEAARVPIPESVAANSNVGAMQELRTNAVFEYRTAFPGALVETCAPTATSLLADQCLTIARMMLGGDTWHFEDLAFEIAARVGSQLTDRNSADAQVIKAAYRKLEWQRERSLGLSRTSEQTHRMLRGDARVLEEVMIASGVPLQPPTDWQPPTHGSR